MIHLTFLIHLHCINVHKYVVFVALVTYKTCFSLFSSADGAERTKNQEHLHSRYLISCRAEVLYVRSSSSCSVSPNFSCSWKQGSVPFNSQICWWWGCEWTKQCGDLSSLTDRRSTQWWVDTVLLFSLGVYTC